MSERSERGQEHAATDRRIRRPQPARNGLRSSSFVFRHRAGNVVIFLVLVVAAAQLFNLQISNAAGLRAEAAGQLKVTDVQQAVRGSIIDRNDDKLAFTIEARALTFQPARIRKELEEEKAKNPDEAPDPDARLREIAADIATRLNNKPDAKTLLVKLTSKDTFAYLARAVDPAVADAITTKFPEVGSERQDIRQYPGGSLAANIVGGIDWDGHGLLGLEERELPLKALFIKGDQLRHVGIDLADGFAEFGLINGRQRFRLDAEIVQHVAQPREDAFEHGLRADIGIAVRQREVLRLHPADVIGHQRCSCVLVASADGSIELLHDLQCPGHGVLLTKIGGSRRRVSV